MNFLYATLIQNPHIHIDILGFGAILTFQAAVVHLHGSVAHAHARKSAIVIQVLHGYLFGKI